MSTPPLKIYGQVNYPNVNKCFNWRTFRPTVKCQFPGLFVEVIDLIKSRLGIPVQLILADERNREYQARVNATDSVERAFSLIRNGTYDLIPAFFDGDVKVHGGGLEPSAPIYESDTRYVLAPVQTLSDVFSFFTVYSTFSWMAIFCTFVIFLLAGLLVCWCASKYLLKERGSLGKFVFQAVRMELMQHDVIKERLLSLNALILVFSLLNCGILINIYSSLITTQAVIPNRPQPFNENNVIQQLKDRRYTLIFPDKYSSHYRDIMNSSRSPYFELRETLQNNPIKLVDEMDPNALDKINYLMDRLKEGNLLTVKSVEQISLDQLRGHCNFVYMNTGFLPKTRHLLMRADHPLLPKINQVIVDEVVHIRRLYDKYYHHMPGAICEEINNGPSALGLTPYIGIMFVLGFGSGGGILFLFVEIWVKKLK